MNTHTHTWLLNISAGGGAAPRASVEAEIFICGREEGGRRGGGAAGCCCAVARGTEREEAGVCVCVGVGGDADSAAVCQCEAVARRTMQR